jgi:hypothetical protein
MATAQDASHRNLHLAKSYALSAIATMTAEFLTFPLDKTKTRMVLPDHIAGHGMIRTTIEIVRLEGARSLFTGLGAALLRQAVYGGIGTGAYRPTRDFLKESGFRDGVETRVLAGFISGGIGSFIANPTDVVKVRLQADRLHAGAAKPRYSGALDAFGKIPFRELYQGAVPTSVRGSIINAAGMATYDTAKHFVIEKGLVDGDNKLGQRLLASSISGLVSTIVSNPIDVVRTRIQNQSRGLLPAHEVYKGSLDCLVKTVKGEGLLALYKGCVPTYTRLAPWQIIFFATHEALMEHFGMGEM